MAEKRHDREERKQGELIEREKKINRCKERRNEKEKQRDIRKK